MQTAHATRKRPSAVGRFHAVPDRCVVVATLIAMISVGWAQQVLAQPPAANELAAAGEWPQFLGPQRNGLSAETGLLDHWPEQGPRELWRVPGGAGMSGLAIRAGQVLTLVQRQGRQWLVAYRADNGETIWESDLAPEYLNAMGDGPRATPCIHDGRVFAFTGEGILVAVDFRSGKRLWSSDTLKELAGTVAEYGMASSPLVVGDEVVVVPGAPKATVAAFDAASGKLRWTAGSDSAGYSSPALRTIGGNLQIVTFTGKSALGIVPKSGKILWRYPFDTNYECNIAVPLEYQGKLLLSAGENHGSVLLSVEPQAAGYEIRPVWESLGTSSVLRSEWQTAVLWNGFLYGMDNVGGAGPITHLTCVDAATGERKWQQTRFGKGNLIGADGKLFIGTMKGELVVARMSPDRYDEMGRATVIGATRQAPSLAGGRLYLRDAQEIVCLDGKSEG